VRAGLPRAGPDGPRRLGDGPLLACMSRWAGPDWRRSVPLCPSSPRFLNVGPSHITTGDAVGRLQLPARAAALAAEVRSLVSAARS
jgi:hypothetical protein